MDGMVQFDLFVHVDSPLLACTLVFLFVIVLGLSGFPKWNKKSRGSSSPCGLEAVPRLTWGLRRQAARGRRNWNGGLPARRYESGKRVRADGFYGEEGPVLLQSRSDGEGEH